MLDVRAVYHKMVAWCQVKGKQPTRSRLVGWLNREDKPMGAITNGSTSVVRSETKNTAGNSVVLDAWVEKMESRYGKQSD
jgi:hypothetical protein